MDVSNLLEQAQKEISNVASEQKFLVKDLFVGHFWNSLPKSDRIRLGVLFFEYAKNGNTQITPLDKTSANQQKYIRNGNCRS